MSENIKILYKNIIGDTKDTIDAIQKFIEKNNSQNSVNDEYKPADSINRVINSVSDENVLNDIQKIIKNL